MAGELAQQVGARIRQRREELGLKQRELADLLGTDAVNNQRISDWERGVHQPGERYLEMLATALDRPIAWFYDKAEGPGDLMGALAPIDTSQLDRIEAKLDRILSLLDGEELPAALEEEADRLDAQHSSSASAPRRTRRTRRAS